MREDFRKSDKVILITTYTARSPNCEKILLTILDASKDDGKLCLNMYDFRFRDITCGMSWPEGLSEMTEYLGVFF
jgi:hypothetical protein